MQFPAWIVRMVLELPGRIVQNCSRTPGWDRSRAPRTLGRDRATELAKKERLQRHYVHELSLTEASAFLYYNFAPPTLRRDIGILGFLHKRVLGECHNAKLLAKAIQVVSRSIK